jgi:hypothetical protein
VLRVIENEPVIRYVVVLVVRVLALLHHVVQRCGRRAKLRIVCRRVIALRIEPAILAAAARPFIPGMPGAR